MSTERYVLEIYEPGSRRDVAETISSDHPFAAIAKSDLINTESFSALGLGTVRVREVEHIIWNGPNGPRHKVCVYTERVTNPAR